MDQDHLMFNINMMVMLNFILREKKKVIIMEFLFYFKSNFHSQQSQHYLSCLNFNLFRTIYETFYIDDNNKFWQINKEHKESFWHSVCE